MSKPIGEHSLVSFKYVKNARGYPLTGEVIDTDGKVALVKAFGLLGPGSVSEVNDVPLEDLEECDNDT